MHLQNCRSSLTTSELYSLSSKRKEYGRANSPDLSPVKNLWEVVQHKVDKIDPATSEATLIENVRLAWCSISTETLDNLICGMPERMRARVQKRRGIINK